MKPRKSEIENPQASLFQATLVAIINPRHPLVRLAERIDWERFEKELDGKFSEIIGAPAKPTRLMVGLHFLKHTFNLSDEKTVERWVENPYWQYFCGMKYFKHEVPIAPSLMTRWRQLAGESGMECLLQETIAAALRMGAIGKKSLKNVNIDTTVQEKAIPYPTDAKLYHAMLRKLVKMAKKSGIPLRQSYARVAKKALLLSGRYFHARQGKRAGREIRRLKTWLGRVIRDISRKIAGQKVLEEIFSEVLPLAVRLYNQKKNDRNKLYSIHAPEVECIAKGKAHKKYEFGNKASFASTSLEGFVVGALGLHGNPYDGHTLSPQLEQVERLCGGRRIGRVFVDRGYRGHGYTGPVEVHICDNRKRSRSLRRWARRRSAIEALLGHMKNDGRLGRNYLQGKEGDRFNVVLCAAGQNLRFLLRFIVDFFCQFLENRVFPRSFPAFFGFSSARAA